MNVTVLKQTLASLDERLFEVTGRRLIREITVEAPTDAANELGFLKLVLWSYVVIVEAAPPAFRYLFSLLRQSDREAMNRCARIREDVVNLRTWLTHNLPSDEEGNSHRRRQAEIWLSINGGHPVNWAQCCTSLCSQVTELLQTLSAVWARASTGEDRATAVQQLSAVIENNWPAHSFDTFIVEAVVSLGITGLSTVKFREARLDKWRQYVGFFEDRESAEKAIRAAIFNDLQSSFVVAKH